MTITQFLQRINSLLDIVIPFIVGLAIFVILWGIFNYIAHSAEEEKRAEARQFVLWGIIGVFFMLSIWGFVNILLNSFNLDKTIDPGDIPKVPMIGGDTTGDTGSFKDIFFPF